MEWSRQDGSEFQWNETEEPKVIAGMPVSSQGIHTCPAHGALAAAPFVCL